MDIPADEYSVIISNLKARYDNVVDLPDRDFLIGITDYIKYVEDTSELTPIIQSIQQERKELEQRQLHLQGSLNKDIKNVASELLESIKKKKISFPQLDEAIKEYNLMGGIADLEDIIRALYDSRYSELVKNFIVVGKNGKEISNFKISDFYEPYMEVYDALIKGYKVALWGALSELYNTRWVVNSVDKPEDYLIRDRMLTKKEYLNKLFRVNRYIIERLSSSPQISNDENTNFVLKDPVRSKWKAQEDKHSGVYEIFDSVKITFHSGAFGGMNALIKSAGSPIVRKQLQEAINKYKQGKSKEAPEINIAEWTYSLRKEKRDFNKYFEIQYIEPQFYQLKEKVYKNPI